MTVDLIITGGTVVSSSSTQKLDIAITEGKIAAIGPSGTMPQAERKISAESLHVLPGVIDCHVHVRDPGATHKEDFRTAAQAAAAGGITCLFDMPNNNPPTSDAERLREKIDLAKAKACVDHGIFGVVLPNNLDKLEELADAGAIGYKVFMGETIGNLPSPDDWELITAFHTIARLGLRVGIHAENRAITSGVTKALRSSGRTDSLTHLESRPSVSEAEAVSRAVILSKVFGTKLHVFHLSSKQGVEAVARAKGDGLDVTAETCAHYLLIDGKTALQQQGVVVKINPPVRTLDHSEALWRALLGGTVDMLASDHSPHSKEEKFKENVWDAVSGFPGVETTVPMILTEVNRGRLSLNHFVKVTSENPAKKWGVYPQKGSLKIGSDADFTIVDMSKDDVIMGENLHSKAKFTPFEGRKVKGLPVYTIVRGHIVMQNGEVTDKAIGELVTPVREPSKLASAQLVLD